MHAVRIGCERAAERLLFCAAVLLCIGGYGKAAAVYAQAVQLAFGACHPNMTVLQFAHKRAYILNGNNLLGGFGRLVLVLRTHG